MVNGVTFEDAAFSMMRDGFTYDLLYTIQNYEFRIKKVSGLDIIAFAIRGARSRGSYTAIIASYSKGIGSYTDGIGVYMSRFAVGDGWNGFFT